MICVALELKRVNEAAGGVALRGLDELGVAARGELGADRIELYTEIYARAHERGDFDAVLAQFQEAAAAATASGLGVNAGHDLNLTNLRDFRIPNLLEVSIGHAFTIDALRWGIPETVRRYLETLSAL